MASHCYFSGPSAELFVEFLVSHSAISDEVVKKFKTAKAVMRIGGSYQPFHIKRSEVCSCSWFVCFTLVKNVTVGVLLLGDTRTSFSCRIARSL